MTGGPIVADASVTLAWLLPDEGSPATDALLFRALSDGLIAPSIWTYEVSNILAIAERGQRLGVDQLEAALDVLTALPIVRIQDDVEDLVHGARATGLTAYDAAYLELADRERLPLATLDQQLRSAASDRGIEVLP